jgi:hypothetical protein
MTNHERMQKKNFTFLLISDKGHTFSTWELWLCEDLMKKAPNKHSSSIILYINLPLLLRLFLSLPLQPSLALSFLLAAWFVTSNKKSVENLKVTMVLHTNKRSIFSNQLSQPKPKSGHIRPSRTIEDNESCLTCTRGCS